MYDNNNRQELHKLWN